MTTFQPYEVVSGPADAGLLIVCDHARNTVPEPYGTLGLPDSEFERHIAYDIGVEAVSRGLAARLNVPLVHSCFSRLLIDPNRGEDDPTIVMRLSDGTVIPGNHPITDDEIARRIERFHRPYHQAVDGQIDRMIASGVRPIIFSIHSFTDRWKGVARPWHAAMLWDSDPRLPRLMIEGLRQDPTLIVGDNEPYDGALKNDTLYRHATSRGLAGGLIEIRQDLIADMSGVGVWVDRLAPLLEIAVSTPDLHEERYFGSRCD